MKKTSLIIAGALAMATFGAQASEALYNSSGCAACHKPDVKLVGPALKDIAAKYKGQDVAATLAAKVKAGGVGVWGQIPMPPSPAPEADIKTVVEWIISSH